MKQENLELDVSQPQQKAKPKSSNTDSKSVKPVVKQPIKQAVLNWLADAKHIFMLILCVALLAMVFSMFDNNRTTDYLTNSQQLRDVLTDIPVDKFNTTQMSVAQVQQYIKPIKQAIEQTLPHPMAQSNFAQLLVDAEQISQQSEQLGAQIGQLSLIEKFTQNSLQQLSAAKANYSKAIEPTLTRMKDYKSEAKFEQLTANANQTELFNALNYKQGEEKLDNLQVAADRLMQGYEALFYAQTKQELTQQLKDYPNLYQHFSALQHNFADIPTKLALKRWLESNIDSLPDVQQVEVELVSQLELTQAKAQLVGQFVNLVEQAKLIEGRLTAHLINQMNVQPSSKLALWVIAILAVFGAYQNRLLCTLNKLLENLRIQVEKTAK
ncbi:hypothetical protein DS2_04200 [Catenovulum agarivorans DS-2]|uniref:Uncharacterized protein n=1 Tax=Catenovulum agarivorans DS-2 TaxID=1328313 RepID=W7R163_9ALTE|nr:hypothetical protein [Catenovulum agarivorans]EWH11345.1 hypothetical protein DS2_04200 [Catenovulum agarivorans DS-2]